MKTNAERQKDFRKRNRDNLMKRLDILIDTDIQEELRILQRETGRTKADLVADAIRLLATQNRRQKMG